MQKITPFLTFVDQAEEAMNFYSSVFPNSKVGEVSRYGEGAPFPPGTVMSANLEIEGQELIFLNGGEHFQFSEGISLFVRCEDQEEIDRLWNQLSADGGEPGRCGWLKDKFGVSWQIIPPVLGEMLGDQDPDKAKRVMEAMLQMDKIEIPKLEEAYAQS